MLVLGLESSCDDTAAAIVRDDGTILSSIVSGQMEAHARFGGVVPEIAARAHLEAIDSVIAAAFEVAGVTPDDIDAVAATSGPGLIGGVMVALSAAKTFSALYNKPFYAVNHLAGHALTARLAPGVAFPYLLLLVSGGHSQIVFVRTCDDFTVLGSTRDDAAGECLDKSAKLLGLPFPGGAHVDALARASQNPMRFALPIPLRGQDGCDFSFAGLKTAMRDLLATLADIDGNISTVDAQDACAALMRSVAAHLTGRLSRAIALCPQTPTALVVAGGVAASQVVRAALHDLSQTTGIPFVAPPAPLCTDNAAMIAWAAIERIRAGDSGDDLGIAPRPRWPLG